MTGLNRSTAPHCTLVLSALLTTLSFAPTAIAEVILSIPGGDDGLQSSLRSNINPGLGAFNAAIVAEDFNLETDATVEFVRFWGLNSADFSNPVAFISSFRIRIFEDDGAGQPGAILSDDTIGTFLISTAPAGTTIYYEYGAPLPAPVELTAGVTYWLSIAANKQFNDTFELWSWQNSPATNGVQIELQFNPTGGWSALSGLEQAVCFELEGTPAPAFCAGDADGSGQVNFGDITNVLGHWLVDYGAGNTGPGDANGDGIVDFGDVTAVLGHWLELCP